MVDEINPDDQDYEGSKHQIFVVRIEELTEGDRGAIEPGERVLVSVRYGDASGLRNPIDEIAPGQPIEIRGAYITPNEARIDADEERLGVLHFTHRPLGWVVYQGRKYS